MKIIITGGAGFIGSAVIRQALEDGHQIVNLDSLTYAANLESLEAACTHPDYHFCQVDIRDAKAVHGVFEAHMPDAIMHLAAETHVDRSINAPGDFITTNVVGTYTLLTEALDYWQKLPDGRKRDFRFLHVSTDEVYGDLAPSAPAFSETTRYAPSSPYSASKASSDHLARAWHRTYGLPTIISNCSNNYGPCQFPEKLIPHIVLSALHGKSLPLYGDGKQIRDWLHVSDHAKALLAIITSGTIGETYNIGGDAEHSNLETVEKICDLLDEIAPERRPEKAASYRELITFVHDRPGHDRRYAINHEKITRELGWQPQQTFESGLRDTICWYLDNERWWQRVLDGSYRLERLGQLTQDH